jgi:hypothetical protein
MYLLFILCFPRLPFLFFSMLHGSSLFEPCDGLQHHDKRPFFHLFIHALHRPKISAYRREPPQQEDYMLEESWDYLRQWMQVHSPPPQVEFYFTPLTPNSNLISYRSVASPYQRRATQQRFFTIQSPFPFVNNYVLLLFRPFTCSGCAP